MSVVDACMQRCNSLLANDDDHTILKSPTWTWTEKHSLSTTKESDKRCMDYCAQAVLNPERESILGESLIEEFNKPNLRFSNNRIIVWGL